MKKNDFQIQPIDHSIYIIRGQRVMLDEDLAKLYGNESHYPIGFKTNI